MMREDMRHLASTQKLLAEPRLLSMNINLTAFDLALQIMRFVATNKTVWEDMRLLNAVNNNNDKYD